MLEKIADKIVEKFYTNYEEEEKELLKCGFFIIITYIFQLSELAIAAIIMKKIVELVLFFLLMNNFRRYTGGYHAPKSWICNIMTITSFILACVLSAKISVVTNYICILISIVVTNVIIIIYAPVENPNRIINNEERKRFRIKSLSYSVVLSIIVLILFKINKELSVYIEIVLLDIVFFIIIGHYKYKNNTEEGKCVK